MGLLDDAIREHMELKRLRGADPAVVAREERDALGPVVREDEDGEGLLAEESGDALKDRKAAHEDLGPEDEAFAEDDAAGTMPAAGDRGPGFAGVGQETAELDMRTVLDEQHEAVDRAGQIDSADALHAHGENAHADEAERDEDVLEETPDFLRDTPEQERLWFEQQGSRDFDFDG
jgi:hypothetical protein